MITSAVVVAMLSALPGLENAQRAADDLKFAQALTLLDDVAAQRDLVLEDVVSFHSLRGAVLASLGRADDAVDEFSALMAMVPDWRPRRRVSPRISAAIEVARAQLSNRPFGLTLVPEFVEGRVRVVRMSRSGALRNRMVAVRIWLKEDDHDWRLTEVPFPTDETLLIANARFLRLAVVGVDGQGWELTRLYSRELPALLVAPPEGPSLAPPTAPPRASVAQPLIDTSAPEAPPEPSVAGQPAAPPVPPPSPSAPVLVLPDVIDDGDAVRGLWGIDLEAGPIVSNSAGGYLGLGMRFGVQLSRRLGLCVSALGGLGSMLGAEGLAQWTFFDRLTLGTGLGVVAGDFLAKDLRFVGAMPVIEGRAAVNLGNRDPKTGRRSGFTIALLALGAFATTTVDAVGVTGHSFSLVFAPRLAIGYDAF